ncbi:hypothetical protein [Haloferax sp. DFSO52]
MNKDALPALNHGQCAYPFRNTGNDVALHSAPNRYTPMTEQTP